MIALERSKSEGRVGEVLGEGMQVLSYGLDKAGIGLRWGGVGMRLGWEKDPGLGWGGNEAGAGEGSRSGGRG